MNDEQILERGGSEEDIRKYAEQNGADLYSPTKELLKNIEEIIPQEMTLGRDNPFLKIMYDHAPNNAKFYEDNVDKINNFRKIALSFISQIATAEYQRGREEIIKLIPEDKEYDPGERHWEDPVKVDGFNACIADIKSKLK
jgi:hypothetical protein